MFYSKANEEAKMVAFSAHKNQMYDIFPYEKHLQDVVDVIQQFGYAGDYISAGALHDSIEDAALTYSKIKNLFGLNVAEMVLAVTDPSDARTRKEKKERVYQKINLYPKALVIKLADRIANISHATRMKNIDKLRMYVKEHIDFTTALRHIGPETEMWQYLDELMIKASEILDSNRVEKTTQLT
jgi:(p)ppGpp synthase/HD superfamily hydrolase